MTFSKEMMTIATGLICVLVAQTFTSCEQHPMPEQTSGTSEVYRELHRPQFHFSPPEKWMNDPNGMVYYDGEYHLFYQYYPEDIVWGPMHWGHAVSPDMIHWEHLPIALYPDSLGLIFSGSAVIDYENTSGFGSEDNPPMVAIFTHHDMEGEKAKTKNFQVQSIAYSLDKGRTFTKYEGNPVVPNPGIKDFRDPKVIWHDASEKWVMIFAAYDKAMIYTSPNLKDWEYASSFGIQGDKRLWECPDLFPMKVQDSDEEKWILITSIQKEAPNGGTATSYFIGDFDGHTFSGDPADQRWLDYGTDNYAMVTWSKEQTDDDRVLGLGWMSNWQYALKVPTEKWRSAMTLPREITLHERADGNYELRSLPVSELNKIEYGSKSFASSGGEEKNILVVDTNDVGTFRLGFQLTQPKDETFRLRISNTTDEYVDIGYAPNEQSYFIDRRQSGISDFSDVFAGLHTAPATATEAPVNVELYVDHSSIEVFFEDGRVVMTDIFFPTEPFSKIEVIDGGGKYFGRSSYSKLKRIW